MYRFYCRRFLNLRGHHRGAYVLAVIEALGKDEPDDSWARELSLEVADCSRRIVLDFPLHTAADRRNSLRKARLLADVTRELCDALEAEAESSSTRATSTRNV
jgi:hypothetical protein